MSAEIERKFLLKGDFKPEAYKSERIVQGYLSSVPERSVRVRIRGEKGFLTVKGKSDSSGIERFEWEKEISVDDANQLLQLCEPGVIDKCRFLIKKGTHTFEVDEFYGDNEGLQMAEIELRTRDDVFEVPDWLGTEVTGDIRYYNTYLSKHPYKEWK